MVFKIILTLIILGVVTVVISENYSPMRTLAWMMILIFLPGVGLLLYFLIGKNYRKSRLISSDEKKLLLDCRDRYESTPALLDDSIGNFAKLATMMSKADNVPLLGDNDVEVYTDFGSMFDSMMRDIESAQQHVHIQFFKIECDEVGNQLGDLLIRKAQEGVEVRLMFDSAGNIGINRKFYRRMQKGGVHVASFLNLAESVLTREANCRNHRKVVVVDGKIGYVGGMNIAERYKKGIHTGIWRDTHLRISGPSVGQLQVAFLIDWRFAAKELLADQRYFPPFGNLGPLPGRGEQTVMQIVTSGPMDEWNAIMQGMVQIIAQSRQYVYIQSPYFLPNEPVLLAIRNAALAGVDVRIMLPERPDKGKLVQWASHSYLHEALAAGAKVYFYQRGYMHAKTIVCDDAFATVGSTNIDIRSLEIDFEINAFLYDPELATRLRNIFLKDQNDCIQVDYSHWERRSRRVRFKESVARLFTPLL